jgi:hypothetical protein
MRQVRNKLRNVRKKAGRSIRETSSAVQLSEYQHVLYESQLQLVPLPYAFRYCEYFGVALPQLFPGFQRVVKGVESSQLPEFFSRAAFNSELRQQFAAVGLQADPREWIVRVDRVHGQPWIRVVPAESAYKLKAALYGGFERVVLDTHFSRAVIHRRNVETIQVLFEPSALFSRPLRSDEEIEDEPSPGDSKLVVFLRDKDAPRQFGLEEYPDEDVEKRGQLQGILSDIELEEEAELSPSEYAFIDTDGEDVWINSELVSILEVPLANVEPAINKLMLEIHDEEQGNLHER